MTIALWLVSVLLLVFGVYMTAMNWAVFVNNYILRKKWVSAVPLVGGIAGAIGLGLLPIEGSWRYAWVPLVVDWGSAPVVVVSLLLAGFGRKRQR